MSRRRWPCCWTYPVCGALLAAVAPGGLLALRALQAGTPTAAAVHGDLSMNAQTYAFLTLYATLVCVFLGWMHGRNEDRLYASSTTDPVTGLSNRRCLDERLDEEVARAVRGGSPLTLLMIDVDGLKQINDTGGHAAGDAALRRVGEALRQTCRRAIDFPARFGGDEFLVLAPLSGAAEAEALGNRIRARLRWLSLRDAPGAPPTTVSVGIADDRSAPALESAALFEAADRALYLAKSAGRDRVMRLPDASRGPHRERLRA
ncbi:MAG: GGDEF domain-containing protein [Myxococcales bacterium]|nr:GGDEF domain-containing protein [Myxococcales bacterium]